ncbi:MAG: tRNA (guanosine(37)-N1)-methyltransferase TrmD [Actinobacteria bacterium]|uniref:tRNA (guanine-N(1)-)-methyltransferase n=1 Tax=freshwater metagenome TaxID=449393 RepID=A0A6J6LH76_9ZZZZ|nr:tRNA (guanosine(37)-N1)-methyltransferase TrmD [Actinomycetota bacterium]MSW47027.1 tRNA (guanosine(37)-N1)-methyltransferase TrmD [Actinomycetota bacterium]MSX25066.1 tRNA (guanosine(37)-N1)-methyltransferase TrmD [Actinomycetota bacterium]MSY46322.1 tRNA (guanosine(37)-N1)-methyltransferase TrmD [Actinomycetota bacterium]MSY56899.1 tRNA (guanosine(37)-N1)-methyltransferase TrmD [Actinomycetota bacterium]
MRIDAVTIFPEYFAPLELSLLGKAKERGILTIGVHDLRSFTTDNHHSVDDTPYGGGAGMVMKPEIWGQALDPLMTPQTDLIILTPAGERFNQRMAEKFANSQHLIFACGRYEGIDARVGQYYASQNFRVHEVSIGDFVLGGGEVASLVMIEAITRLLPGVLGNPESLVEESHAQDGFLEYPSYTKPHTWRGIEVPEILLSGNHAAIAAWRSAQSLKRATERL